MMFHRISKMVTLAVMATLAIGCAATTIQVPRLKPAEVNLGQVKKVAIGAIEGDGGEDISDRLTAAIMATGKYDVLDRKNLAEIAREKQIAASDSGAAYGPVLGAAVLIFGRVTRNSFEEKVTADQQTCLLGNREVPCTKYTRVGKHSTSVSFKVVDAASGKILATKLIDGSGSDKREVDVQEPRVTDPQAVARIIPPFEDRQNFRDVAMGDVVSYFIRMIAPYTIMVSVVLYEQDNQASKVGVSAAKTGDWTTAIENFKTALKAAKTSTDLEVKARAHYNLGVALGYSGSYGDGIAEIEKARALHSDDRFAEEIQNIKQFQADDSKLKAQAG